MDHALQTAKTLLNAQRDVLIRLRTSQADEPYLVDYVNTVMNLQKEIQTDLSAFLVPKEAVNYKLEGIQEFGEDGRRISDNRAISWCEKELLLGKINALIAYIDNNDIPLESQRPS